jgi:Rha family phage regulatory protein
MFRLVNFHESFYAIRDGKQWATSLNIAEVFGKSHQHIMEAIRNLECSEGFRESNFRLSFYITSQNKEMPMYDITRDGFTFLAMGFTGRMPQFCGVLLSWPDSMD